MIRMKYFLRLYILRFKLEQFNILPFRIILTSTSSSKNLNLSFKYVFYIAFMSYFIVYFQEFISQVMLSKVSQTAMNELIYKYFNLKFEINVKNVTNTFIKKVKVIKVYVFVFVILFSFCYHEYARLSL